MVLNENATGDRFLAYQSARHALLDVRFKGAT